MTDKPQRFKTGKYAGNKWGGKYLRAPDIFYTILEKGKDKLVRLGDIAEVRRGFTTGANEFFYLDKEKQEEWKIEEEYLKPVIKGPRECNSLIIDPKKLKFKILVCNKPKSELKGTKVLEYINWGENQTVEIKSGGDKGTEVNGYNNISTVKSRKLWYSLGDVDVPDLAFPCGIRETFKVFINTGCLIDKRLYEIYIKEKSVEEFACSLNSSVFFFMVELFCRNYGGGGGPIDATVEEVQKILIVNPKTIKSKKCKVPKREIESIFDELGFTRTKPIREQEPKPLPDRAELDNIIFEELGLTKEERKEVYWSLCELVKERLDKAGSLKEE